MSRAPEGDSPAHEMVNGNGHGTDNGNGLVNRNGHRRVHDGRDQRITAVALDSENNCILEESVNGISAKILVDTGAAATLLSRGLWDKADSLRVCKAANSLAYN